MQYCFTFLFFVSTIVGSAQNVGIGNLFPAYKLDVNGTMRTVGRSYFNDHVLVGTPSGPDYYSLQVNDGEMAIYSIAHNKHWVLHYRSIYSQFAITESSNGTGTVRLVINNGGNVGIGTYQPTAKLHVEDGDLKINNGQVTLSNNGTDKGFVQLSGENIRVGTFSSNNTGSFVVRTNGADRMEIDASGNTELSGNLTVSGGKGIIKNAEGSGQLKYYTEAFTFSTGSLGGHALSGEGSILFSVPFSSTPVVTVGNIVSTGGISGELYRVQLILYGCNTTGCKARLLNTSPSAVNYSVTWNIVCIGQ